ncbi:hypothetical protein CYMTET_46795 [Cymbomonas tetramitiformis]|uniref:Uncharacterized protein n=1 Tax=Cymbomonas tetramitiformis TaxID=36881 RepID=A0AAE0EXA0_9CHLO|nr:hypothetical protein CYMTET_46795 [Cymbomonas tetramitiformis]
MEPAPPARTSSASSRAARLLQTADNVRNPQSGRDPVRAGVSFVQVGDQGGQAGAAAAVDVFDEEPANEEGGTPE